MQMDQPTNSHPPIQIGLVEDQLLFREGIKAILSAWPSISVVFESSTGYSVIDSLLKMEKIPDVMLVDLSLPPDGQREYSGLRLTEALRATFPHVRILILSVYEDKHFISKLIRAGANGYLVKDSSPTEVAEAIWTVFEKGAYINGQTLSALQQENETRPQIRPTDKTIFEPVALTRREEEVLELICQQKTSDEIAGQLFISTKTVNGHRNNLLQKTNSRNVAGLVTFALGRKK